MSKKIRFEGSGYGVFSSTTCECIALGFTREQAFDAYVSVFAKDRGVNLDDARKYAQSAIGDEVFMSVCFVVGAVYTVTSSSDPDPDPEAENPNENWIKEAVRVRG